MKRFSTSMYGGLLCWAILWIFAQPALSQETILLDFETLSSGANAVTNWSWGTTTVTAASIGNIVDPDIVAAGGGGKGARASGTTYGGTLTLNGAVGTSITFLYGATGNSPPNSGGFKAGVFNSDGVRGNSIFQGGTGAGFGAGPVTLTGHSQGNPYFNSFRWSTTFPGGLAEIDNVLITVVPVNKVAIAWGVNAPFSVATISNAFGDREKRKVINGVQTTAGLVPPEIQTAVMSRLQQIFSNADMQIEFVSGQASDAQTTVYIGDYIDSSGLLGKAVTGVDTFNRSWHDQAIVYLKNRSYEFPELDGTWQSSVVNRFAQTIAHEIGHTLGLAHIESSLDVMGTEGDFPGSQFVNNVTPLNDNPLQNLFFDHNTVYHLRRYTKGETQQQLEAAGVHPGNYDEGLIANIRFKLNLAFQDDATLYNVSLLSDEGAAGNSLTTFLEFEQITLSQLSALELELLPGANLGVLAASVPGGSQDVTLTTANPYDEATNYVSSIESSPFSIVVADTAAPAGIHTLSSGNLVAINLPNTLPGDINLDGVVDAADYVAWRKTAGNMADYDTWRSHFGQPPGSGSAASSDTAVPEPSTFPLLLALLALTPLRRSK